MKIKKGDTVLVTTGKDKGKKGKVEKIFPEIQMVLVPGVNIYKRHLKKRDEKHPSGIIDLSLPLFTAKVAVVCPACGQPTRVGFLQLKGEKERICLKCKQRI